MIVRIVRRRGGKRARFLRGPSYPFTHEVPFRMIRSHTRALIPLFLGSILAVTGCGKGGAGVKDPLSNSSGGSSSEFVGKPPPDLSIQTLNGKGKISLESLQGKVVILD